MGGPGLSRRQGTLPQPCSGGGGGGAAVVGRGGGAPAFQVMAEDDDGVSLGATNPN